MKKIKRTVSLLLVAVTLISMCQCSLSVFAATNDETQVNENQGITYSVDDENKTLTISGTGEMENYDSNTPPWYSYRNSVTKIVIKDGVTSLGKYAFYNFIALEKIEIPSSVKSIGYECFSNCKSLKTVTIEEGCESIEYHAFYNCTALEKIEIPSSVKSIGYECFSKCESLKEITLPKSLTSLKPSTFYGCTSLEKIEIPSSVKSIGYDCFSKCESLKEITLSKSLTSLEPSTFYGCTSLEKIEIPSSVKSICSECFSNCKSLKTVTIEEGCESIEYHAFYNCTALEKIEIPLSVHSIGGSVFSNANDVTIYAKTGSYAKEFADRKGIKFSSTGVENYQGSCGENASYNLDTENCVLTISGTGAMSDYDEYNNKAPWYLYRDYVKKLVVKDGITSIGKYSLYNCEYLVDMQLPDSVNTVGENAFSNCTSLEKIEIPLSVHSIGGSVFSNANDVTIYAKTGSYAKEFADRKGIKFSSTGVENYQGSCGENASYNLDTENCVLTISGTGAMSDYDEYNNKAPWYLYRDYVKKLVVKDGITSIGKYSLYNCEYLVDMQLPDSVNTVGENAFSNCTSLEKIEIPSSVKSICSECFSNCKSLKTVTIEEGCESIENYAFYKCTALEKIEIPSSVKSIGYGCFSDCKSLKTVIIEEGCESIENYAFENCTALEKIEIPLSVHSIGRSVISNENDVTIYAKTGSYAKEFADRKGIKFSSTGVENYQGSCGENASYNLDTENCVLTISGTGAMSDYDEYNNKAPWYLYRDYVKKLVVKDGITSIGKYSLYNCEYLVDMQLPDSLKAIGSYAFNYCECLEGLTLPDSVNTVGEHAFSNCKSLKEITLPKSLTSLKPGTFYGCTSLEKIEIPSSVKSIGNACFSNCKSLKTVIIEEGCESIENYAFYCTALENIIIPVSVHSIGDSAFRSANNLTIRSIVASTAFDYAYKKGFNFQSLSGNGSGYAIYKTDKQYCGLILRLTSTDGERVYSKIITDYEYNTVYGLDTSKEYVAEIASKNGNVFCSESNITFDENNSAVLVFENCKKPLDVELKIVDKDGNSISDFSAEWTDKNGKYITNDKCLNERITGEKLSFTVKLGKSLSSNYQAFDKSEITLSENSDNVIKLELKPYSKYTLSGRVIADNKPLSNVTVVATQKANDNSLINLSATTDKNGEYTLSLNEGEYKLSVEKYGYLKSTVSGTISQDKTEDIILNEVKGKKLNFTLSSTTLKDSGTSFAKVENLDITLKNNTKDTIVEILSVTNSSIYFGEDAVSDGDALELNVKDKNGIFADFTTFFDYSSEESIYMSMVEKGKLSVDINKSNNKSNIMMLFDENGKYLETYYISRSSCKTNNLDDGNYFAVIMGEDEYPISIESLESLKNFGYVESEDYLKIQTKVKDGRVTELNDLKIPDLDLSKRKYLDCNETSLVANNMNVASGQYFVLKAQYKSIDEYNGNISNEKVVFNIPENLTVMENAITVDGTLTTDYVFEDGNLIVNTGKKDAVVRLCLINTKSSDKVNLSAYLKFEINGNTICQSIGNTNVKLGEIDFYLPTKTSQDEISVNGTTFAEATINIYENNNLVATVQADKLGSFIKSFKLNKTFAKSNHKIQLEIIKKDGIKLYSSIRTVEYDKKMPVPKKLYVTPNAHSSPTFEIDYLNTEQKNISYAFNPSKPTFTFQVEFTNDPTQLKDVAVITYDKNGKETTIPLTYDEETKRFIGSYSSFTSQTIPTQFVIGYDSNYSDSSIDIDAFIEEALNEETVQKDVGYIMGLSEKVSNKVVKNNDGSYCITWNFGSDKYVINISSDFQKTDAVYYSDGKAIFTNQISLENKGTSQKVIDYLTDDGFTEIPQVDSLKANSDVSNVTGNSIEYYIYSYTDLGNYESGQAFANSDGDIFKSISKVYDPSGIENLLDVSDDNNASISSNFSIPWTDIWSLATGDGSLEQIAKYNAYMDRLEDCYNQKGLPASSLDDMKSEYRTMLALYATQSIGTFAANCTSKLNYLIYTIGNVFSDTDMGLVTYGMYSAFANLIKDTYDAMGQNVTTIGAALKPNASFIYSIANTLLNLNNRKLIDDRMNGLLRVANRCQQDLWNNKTGAKGVKGTIDPSGYICEAVDSNRLEGVTCTIFYSPNADGSNAVVWDAEEYGQSNPLLSDKNGYYEWYVPEGYWQVKYEKDGYITEYSDWLPVPPPQTEVNISMTSYDAPKVKDVFAYNDEIIIEFSQYMNIYTINENNVTITLNGTKVNGKLSPVNSESGAKKTNMRFADTFKFIPENSFTSGDKVKISISNAVNYADNSISSFENMYDVSIRPEKIEADQNISIEKNDTAEINLQVVPAEAGANKSITVDTSDSSLLEVLTPSVTTDENGKATVKVKGILPGEAEITYTLDGSNCTGKTIVKTKLAKPTVSRVSASIPSNTTVKKGTTLELTTSTEGAEIYYTTDLTCPCIVDSESRIKYTGPITITEDTTIIAYAVKDGYTDSKTTLFIYSVEKTDSKIGDVNGDGVVDISDVALIQKYISSLVTPDEIDLKAADVNKDGKITVADATLIQKYIAQIITDFDQFVSAKAKG